MQILTLIFRVDDRAYINNCDEHYYQTLLKINDVFTESTMNRPMILNYFHNQTLHREGLFLFVTFFFPAPNTEGTHILRNRHIASCT